MYTKRSLEQLEEQRERIGPIGALNFLIEYERSKGGPERQARRYKPAAGEQALSAVDTEKNLLPTHDITPIGKKKVPDIARPKVLNRIDRIRIKLLSLGFTEEPLAELEDIALHNNHKSQRARAAQTIALWYLRINTLDSCMTALRYIQLAEKMPALQSELN